MTNEWLTVANAARLLSVSKQAIRQRIYRNTIPHRKDADGTVYVRITPHNQGDNGESYDETPDDMGPVSRELVDELRDRIGFLERQLENEQRAHAELRRLLAGALERIPELEPPKGTPSAPRESPVSDEEGPPYGTAPQDAEASLHHLPYGEASPGCRGDTEPSRPPWWRRLFGG
jgi:hypothetical protein